MGRYCRVAGISPANKIPFSKDFSISIHKETEKRQENVKIFTDQRNMNHRLHFTLN